MPLSILHEQIGRWIEAAARHPARASLK